MKNPLLAAMLFVLLTASLVVCAEKTGSLNVFSKIPDVKIYIDEEFKGTDKVKLEQVQAGSHYVKATKDDKVVYEEIIVITAGELTSIFITDKKQAPTGKPTAGYQQPVYDYSKEMHQGWFIKGSYITNIYQSTQTSDLDNYASSFGIGIGAQIPIAPGIDFLVMLDRTELNSEDNHWFLMPITANIQFGYLPSAYFGGKQYMGLGIGYFMTNLRTTLEENLTSFGYHLYYGLEMPAGPNAAFYFDFGYEFADLSQFKYLMASQYMSAGYRFYVQ